MGVKFGEIDSGQILENEYRIAVLERMLEFLVNNNPTISTLGPQDIVNIRNSVVEELQAKYPKSGISLKRDA